MSNVEYSFKKLLFLLKLCETVSPVHKCAWQIGVSLDIIYSVHVHISEIPFLVSAAATLYSPSQQPASAQNNQISSLFFRIIENLAGRT